jgi:AcrR family transcriptional regulator
LTDDAPDGQADGQMDDAPDGQADGAAGGAAGDAADGAAPVRRKARDRARTETDLLASAWRILRRDGVLAGLNLQQVAAEAGVNRGQIYQVFGSRQALLRTALSRALDTWRGQTADSFFATGFAARRRAMLRLALEHPVIPQILALLALDGDQEFHPLPAFETSRAALARDKETGALRAEVDGEAAHVLAVATQVGYAVMRESLARDTGIPLTDLDQRVLAVFDDYLDSLSATSTS